MTRVLGAVLAGGESRRFGSDKAVAMLDGQSLIDRVIGTLLPQVDAIAICGRPSARYTALSDRPAPGLGPLGGLNAALHYAAAHGFAAVLSTPCDTPDLPADLASRLADTGTPAYLSTLPVIGLWPSSLATVLDRHLGSTADRSVRLWATVAGARPVDVGPLSNINFPHDLHSEHSENGKR